MKKMIVIAFVAMMWCGTVSARTVSNLIAEFRGEPQASFIHVPKTMIRAGLSMVPQLPIDLKGVSSVEVLNVGDCSKKVKRQFMNRLNETDDLNNYSLLLKNSDGGENTRIYAKEKNGNISEMVVITWDRNDATLVRMKGKISPDSLQPVLSMNK
ncbi:MAG: DUF4252 domain-containing protein [Muribaculaceae bacterium]|nr:DUF4252 domain-containing protein [Muribaculaceae bacterium]